MQISKNCLALSFFVGMAVVPAGHAAVTGNLVSLSVTIPDYPSLTTTLDLAQPGITGELNIVAGTDLSSILSFNGTFTEDYHAVHLDAGALSSDMYYPHSVYYFAGGSNSYDAGTRTLSLNDVPASFGAGGNPPFCIGSIALCNAAYESSPSLGLLDLVLVFDEGLQNITGTATFSHTLANGTMISGQYNFEGSPNLVFTPVPAAGWLLGSGLIGLAGAVRRRRSD